jgi:hypothetical protein
MVSPQHLRRYVGFCRDYCPYYSPSEVLWMPRYDEVDWDQAACRGTIYTDLLYSVEEQRSIMQYEYINALRSICGQCPIWEECLTYAMENESYGVWGGMTSIEGYLCVTLNAIRVRGREL